MFKQLAIFITLTLHIAYGMNCVEFNSFRQHNGHWYTITHNKLTFADAKIYAKKNNGYIAIPNNAVENHFLSTLISRDAAWIGVYDPAFIQNQCNVDNATSCVNNDIRFKTVKGSSLTYKNWNYGEPNNAVYNTDFLNGKALVSPTGEYWVILSAGGKWADVGNHIQGNAETVRFQTLLEFDSMPICATQPTDNTDIIDQIGADGKAVCNTKIYNHELNITAPHKTFDCQIDEEGTQYCPYMLAECGQEWDYYPGTAIEHTVDVPCDKTMKGSSLEKGQCVGVDACLEGTYDVSTGKCKVASTELKCNGQWQYFGMNDYIWMSSWDPNGKIFNWETKDRYQYLNQNQNQKKYKFYTGLRYRCTNSSSVRFEQMHKITGSINKTIWSLVYKNIDMRNIESNPNYDTGLKRSPHEGWADARYYVPSKDYMDLYLNTVTRRYMDGFKYRFKRTGDNLFFRIENTYDGAGWTTRDIIQGTSPLYTEKFVTSQCSNGTDGVTSSGQCYANHETYNYYEYLCDHGGEVVNRGGDCEGKDLVDTNGDGIGESCNSSTVPENNCKNERFVCLSDKDRPCVKVNNKMQCSPFPCFGSGDIVDLDTPVGISDKNNDGWTETGNCAGQLYIFNGQDNRCRSKMAFGIVNDCCRHDAFLFGLVECRDYEQVLDRKKEDKRCHYIGQYCSDKILGACVQKKKTFCCFNSKLARIIVEEGREQLKGLDWGGAKHPNCRGFTPEEFEKIDFSRIDLTEFTDDIQNQINVTHIQNTADRLKDKIDNMQGN